MSRASIASTAGGRVTRVLIAAKSPIERMGLASLLSADPALEIAGDPNDVAPLDERVAAEAPDVVVIVIDLRGETEEPAPASHEAAREGVFPKPGPSRPLDVNSSASGPAWLILADDLEAAQAAGEIPAGVHSYLPRDAEEEEIRAAIHAAAAGLVAFRPDALDELKSLGARRSSAAEGRNPSGAQPLTAREIEVLRMLAEGSGNKEIAWKLKISEHTVKFHISSIFTKLDVASRTEAVTAGIRFGLIML